MRLDRNTRCLPKDVEGRPLLVSAGTRAAAGAINHGRSRASPGEGLTLFDTRHVTCWLLARLYARSCSRPADFWGIFQARARGDAVEPRVVCRNAICELAKLRTCELAARRRGSEFRINQRFNAIRAYLQYDTPAETGHFLQAHEFPKARTSLKKF